MSLERRLTFCSTLALTDPKPQGQGAWQPPALYPYYRRQLDGRRRPLQQRVQVRGAPQRIDIQYIDKNDSFSSASLEFATHVFDHNEEVTMGRGALRPLPRSGDRNGYGFLFGLGRVDRRSRSQQQPHRFSRCLACTQSRR